MPGLTTIGSALAPALPGVAHSPAIERGEDAAPSQIVASAPGRICLFGEHQDYLGLPVIAAAVDLRIEVRAQSRPDGRIRVSLPDVGDSLDFDPNEEQPYRHGRDYLPAAVNVLRRGGLRWTQGWDVEVSGQIPINSGTSSSSALQVAWCSFLLGAAGDHARAADPQTVALAAYQSEVPEFGSPGGCMDHFSSAYGGIIWLDSACNRVERLEPWLGEFVLVDSGIPKDTNGLLGATRARVEQLGVDFRALEPELAPERLKELLGRVAPADAPLLAATLENRALTARARAILHDSRDSMKVCHLLNQHHAALSGPLGVSHPAIDKLLMDGRARGALGGKINGSGGGGSFFLVTPGRGEQVRQYYQDQGLRAWVIRVGGGVRFEEAPLDATPSEWATTPSQKNGIGSRS